MQKLERKLHRTVLHFVSQLSSLQFRVKNANRATATFTMLRNANCSWSVPTFLRRG